MDDAGAAPQPDPGLENPGSEAGRSEAGRFEAGRFEVRRAEAEQARTLADHLRQVDAAEAALHAERMRLLADAFALAETQRARILSTRSKERDMPLRSLAAEMGLAVRVNDRTMQAHMWTAHRLITEYPATLTALGDGRIARGHVSAILDVGAPIEDPAARAVFEQTVLDYAAANTAARTRSFAKTQADIHNPRTMQERHDLAMQGRRSWVTDLDDGMSLLCLLTNTAVAHGIHDRTTRQARAIKMVPTDSEPGDVDAPFTDERTLDQIRADLIADMLLTGAPAIDPTTDASPGGLGAIRATVQITVPVTTLTGETPGGAGLDDKAPIDPDTARRLAGDAPGCDRIMTHPVTGMVLAVDRYQPTAEQRRFLRARDQHCRFPGCRRPARACEHDHTVDWAHGGTTRVCNLCCLCKRHHTLKHATDWTVRQLPGGTLEWTSPGGHRHLDDPPPRVVFRPSGDDPPPW